MPILNKKIMPAAEKGALTKTSKKSCKFKFAALERKSADTF